MIRGRRDFEADASLRFLLQHHLYFGSAVAIETLSRPPAPPISEEMFTLDPLILYPDEIGQMMGKLLLDQCFLSKTITMRIKKEIEKDRYVCLASLMFLLMDHKRAF